MKRVLRIIAVIFTLLVIVLLGLAVYVLAAWDRLDERKPPQMTARRDSAAIARGEHIFKDTWQCWGCHASPASDGNSVPSGGQKFDLRKTGPGFGIYYSRNVTPDSATGIGAWTDGEIVQAIREGVRRDRHMLFPLMPVDWLKGLSDEDALARGDRLPFLLHQQRPVLHAVTGGRGVGGLAAGTPAGAQSRNRLRPSLLAR